MPYLLHAQARSFRSALAPLVLALIAAAPNWAFSSNFANVHVFDGTSNAVSQNTVHPTAIPFNHTHSVSDSAGNVSTTTYDLSDSAFDIQWNQARSSALFGAAYATTELHFTVANDTPFMLSGFFTMTDTTQPATCSIYVYLYHSDPPFGMLSETHLDSTQTLNESWTLGTPGGDARDVVQGSLTGTLLAGHWYELFAVAYINTRVAGDLGGTATGNVHLDFGIVGGGAGGALFNITLLPEPASLGAVLGAFALLATRRPMRH